MFSWCQTREKVYFFLNRREVQLAQWEHILFIFLPFVSTEWDLGVRFQDSTVTQSCNVYVLTWWMRYVIWCLRRCCPVGWSPFFYRHREEVRESAQARLRSDKILTKRHEKSPTLPTPQL